MNNILLLYQLGEQTPGSVLVGLGAGGGAVLDGTGALLRRCSFSVGAPLAVPEQETSRALKEGPLQTSGLCVGEKGQGAWTGWRARAVFSLLHG